MIPNDFYVFAENNIAKKYHLSRAEHPASVRSPSPVLKPLSKIVAEDRKKHEMKPPPLDKTFPVDIDIDEPSTSSGRKRSFGEYHGSDENRESYGEKLTVKFASHLGLGKKQKLSNSPKEASTLLQPHSSTQPTTISSVPSTSSKVFRKKTGTVKLYLIFGKKTVSWSEKGMD